MRFPNLVDVTTDLRKLVWPFLLVTVVSCQVGRSTAVAPTDDDPHHGVRDSIACRWSNDFDGAQVEQIQGTRSITSFIAAECHLSRGERNQAERALWDALRDEAGRSSIVGFALWRIVQEFSLKESTSDVFALADAILSQDGRARGLFELDGIQFTGTSLVHFQTEIWAALSQLSWERDMPFRSALYGYLAGVKGFVSQREHKGNLEQWAKEITLSRATDEERRLTELYLGDRDDVATVRDYWLEGGRRDLMHAAQLRDLRLFRQAVRPLRNALSSEDVDIRLRSHIDLARMGRRIALTTNDRLEIIRAGISDGEHNSAQPALLQDAFIQQGRILDAVDRRDPSPAIRSYRKAVNICNLRDCDDDLTYEAIYLTARRLEQAAYSTKDDDGLHYLRLAREEYAMLQAHRGGEHPRAESAYFRAGLLEYGDGQHERALMLLNKLVALDPYPSKSREDSKIYKAALFWLARIYREQGLTEKSDTIISTLLPNRGPHVHRRFSSYYGIRALMLQNGQSGRASPSSLVYPDEDTNLVLSNKYLAPSKISNGACDSDGMSTSLKRLCWGLQSGLYRWARQEIVKAWTTGKLIIGRNDPYYILDAMGTLLPLAIWRSMRSDVFSEQSIRRSPTQRLHFARKLAEAGDWNASVMVLDRWGMLGASAGHLAAAFPPTYVEEIQDAVSGDVELAEFVYSVMRQESVFSETALSRAGAFGLFQFMPSTFESLVEDGNLERRETFLADASHAIDLGSSWLRELRERHDHNLVLAAMEHNAGQAAVDRWFYYVGDDGRRSLRPEYSGDVEWLVETAWGPETRSFAREFLTNLAIARAAKMFKESNVLSAAEAGR